MSVTSCTHLLGRRSRWCPRAAATPRSRRPAGPRTTRPSEIRAAIGPRPPSPGRTSPGAAARTADSARWFGSACSTATPAPPRGRRTSAQTTGTRSPAEEPTGAAKKKAEKRTTMPRPPEWSLHRSTALGAGCSSSRPPLRRSPPAGIAPRLQGRRPVRSGRPRRVAAPARKRCGPKRPAETAAAARKTRRFVGRRAAGGGPSAAGSAPSLESSSSPRPANP